MDVFININAAGADNVKISVNRPVVEGYLSAMKQIAADYDVRDDISVGTLTRMGDVLLVEKREEDETEVQEACFPWCPRPFRPLTPCVPGRVRP